MPGQNTMTNQLRTAALLFTMFWSLKGDAGPQAKILTIDSRLATSDAVPILSTVIDISDPKDIHTITSDCDSIQGNDLLQCYSDKLSTQRALFTPLDFPHDNAIFTVLVNETEFVSTFDSKYKWEKNQHVAGVATSWLIILDLAKNAGSGTPKERLNRETEVADAFIDKMGPQDLANIVLITDTPLKNSGWKTSAQKKELNAFIETATIDHSVSANRPLATILTQTINDGFHTNPVAATMHQSIVVLSNGTGGQDPACSVEAAREVRTFASIGRFPPANATALKRPTPIISIFFPDNTSERKTPPREAGLDFMMNLANVELGGYFNVVQAKSTVPVSYIVDAVRDRFNQMYLVQWRVPCVSYDPTQTFILNFQGTNPGIMGDNSFEAVPLGIDPAKWPLDVDRTKTADAAKKNPVYPGGKVTIYGTFCWGTNASRVQAYFLPPGTGPTPHGYDSKAENRRRTTTITARKLDGRVLQVSPSTAEFEAPNKTDWIWGQGESAVARIVVYDTTTRRVSGLTATTVLTVKAIESTPFNWLWVALPMFALVLVLLPVVLWFKYESKLALRSAPKAEMRHPER